MVFTQMVTIQLVTGSGLLLLLVSINLSYVEPSCTLLDFRGRPIKRAGYVHSALNYLRYDSSFYTPYSFFNSTLGLDCVNSNITYKNRRLSIILYCPIAPGPADQQYIDVFPTDPKLIRLAHRWNDCHSTTYRLHYDDASRSFYLKATMNTEDGNRTSMFLAQKQWADSEIEKMDSKFDAQYSFHPGGNCSCRYRLEMLVAFDRLKNCNGLFGKTNHPVLLSLIAMLIMQQWTK